jgi:hypothetical protein
MVIAAPPAAALEARSRGLGGPSPHRAGADPRVPPRCQTGPVVQHRELDHVVDDADGQADGGGVGVPDYVAQGLGGDPVGGELDLRRQTTVDGEVHQHREVRGGGCGRLPERHFQAVVLQRLWAQLSQEPSDLGDRRLGPSFDGRQHFVDAFRLTGPQQVACGLGPHGDRAEGRAELIVQVTLQPGPLLRPGHLHPLGRLPQLGAEQGAVDGQAGLRGDLLEQLQLACAQGLVGSTLGGDEPADRRPAVPQRHPLHRGHGWTGRRGGAAVDELDGDVRQT